MVGGKVQNKVTSFMVGQECIPTMTARLSFFFSEGKVKNLPKMDDTEV